MERAIDTEEMIYMIEVFLGLSKDSTYTIDSLTDRLTILFTGDSYKVQTEILKWLTVSDRLENMKLMEKYRGE